MSRKTWERIALDTAVAVSRRSLDKGTQVGAVVLLDNRIIGMGYNGHPRGSKSTLPTAGPDRLKTMIHAEANAIFQAVIAKGDWLDGATLFCTHRPCADCLKLMSHVGIKTFVYILDELRPEQLERALDVQTALDMRGFEDEGIR